MSNGPVFVGLDYHQDSLQVCVLDQQGKVLMNRSASNSCDELHRLVSPLRFKTANQLSRYCGMSPCNASSGNKVADAGLINGCNKMLRMTVVQAAHRLVRTVPRGVQLASSLKARGKPPCVIIGAVGNRWLRNLHHTMKENNDNN